MILLTDEKVGYLPPNFFIQKLIPLTTHCYVLPLVVSEPAIIVFSFFVRGMDDTLPQVDSNQTRKTLSTRLHGLPRGVLLLPRALAFLTQLVRDVKRLH